MKTNCRFLIVHGLSISWLSSLSFAASSIKKNKNKIKKTTAKWNQTLLKREISEENEQTPLALWCLKCLSLRGEKLNYNSCANLLLRKSQNLLFLAPEVQWALKVYRVRAFYSA